MRITPTNLQEVLLIEPDVYGDGRGFFMESWHRRRYEESGIPSDFVQDNLSRSSKGVLRGLHFQNPNAQGKLVCVLDGAVFDVAVDIRRNSPTYGTWVGEVLSSENKNQLYIPPGFAHGFCVLSDSALFTYKCTAFYEPDHEHAIRWDDPEIGIEWPTTNPTLSTKDESAPPLSSIPVRNLPVYAGRVQDNDKSEKNSSLDRPHYLQLSNASPTNQRSCAAHD